MKWEYCPCISETNRIAREHQTQLAHVAHLNTMGEMATGIAHELNQPLTAIRNYSNVCLRLSKNRDSHRAELQEAITSIEHDAHRAAAIIKRLREFIKRGELARETFLISECIEPALELLRPRLLQHEIDFDGVVPGHFTRFRRIVAEVYRSGICNSPFSARLTFSQLRSYCVKFAPVLKIFQKN